MADIETMMISRLIDCKKKEAREFFDQQISTDHLVSRARELGFLTKFWDKHKKMPSRALFKKEFPQFRGVKTKDGITAYTDQVRERYCWRLLSDMQEGMVDTLKKGGTAKDAVKNVSRYLNQIVVEVQPMGGSSWKGDYIKEKKAYKHRLKNKLYGVPLPWPTLDKALLGFNKEHLVAILGRPYQGKTYILLACAYFAWVTGHDVLILTKEMSEYELKRRLYAMHFKLPYEKFRAGTLSKKQLDRFMKKGKMAKAAAGEITIISDHGGGVRSLGVQIDRMKPDIVFIDGFYKMEDDRGAKDNKTANLYNITADLKLATNKFKIPIVYTQQQGRDSSRKKGGGIDKAQWADSTAQDADEIIEVFGELDDQNQAPTRSLSLPKVREGPGALTSIYFNFKKMDFSECGKTVQVDKADIPDDAHDFNNISF